MKTLIYLAVPYSHPDPAVREQRFNRVNAVAADMMRRGMHIFSPISHTHPIALSGGMPLGWDFWEAYDTAILQFCAKLVVLKLEGWDASKGIAGEIGIAKKLGIPVEFIDP